MSKPAPSPVERILTRGEYEAAINRLGMDNSAAESNRLGLHDAALRAALKKAEEGDVQRVRDITKFVTERDRARERVAELEASLENLFGLVESGYLVRDVSHDHEEGWAMKQMRPMMILKEADAALRSLRGEKEP